MFNEQRIVERAADGELTAKISKSREPITPALPLPRGSRSQIITYIDRDGKEVASAHQYLLPDGTLAAGGLPDPKRLLLDGILYFAFWVPPRPNM